VRPRSARSGPKGIRNPGRKADVSRQNSEDKCRGLARTDRGAPVSQQRAITASCSFAKVEVARCDSRRGGVRRMIKRMSKSECVYEGAPLLTCDEKDGSRR
jgi:hypothetical protein